MAVSEEMTEQCKGVVAGAIRPVIDLNKCEGKDCCAEICPYNVFKVVSMTDAQFRSLTFRGKVKAFVHGKKTASTPNADQCMNCGLCVPACPETAIRLEKYLPDQ